MSMQIWGLTDVGNLRQENQDAYAIVSLGYDRALVIVCDGKDTSRRTGGCSRP